MVKLIKNLLVGSKIPFKSASSKQQKITDPDKNDQNVVMTRGWDGSSVVLIGFKHYQTNTDDAFVVQEENSARLQSEPTISPTFEEVTSFAAITSREDRLNSCESADSGVSCILAYNEDISAFLTNSNREESPRSFLNPSSPSSNNSKNSPPFFPEAINSLFPPPPTADELMDLTERFSSTNPRRFQTDLKRRTSSIQPFPSAFRVLLESGETRSFRYDNDTTVNDILSQLQEKLNISVVQHFGFVLRRANEIVFVLPETMKISDFVDWCAANEYECSLRVVFPPKQPEDFLLVDPVAFDYLYTQCTNDVLAGRFEAELGVDKAIYLSALHILQFAIASNLSGKLTTRRIDKEFGLERFIPNWVRERGRGRTVEHAVSESLRHLTERQRGAGQQNYKMQYVKLLSLMADYGAHAFPAVLLGFTEEKCSLLLGPNCGISYLPASLTQTKPVFLIRFEHIRCIGLNWSGQTPTNITCSVHHVIKDITPIQFLLPRWLKDSFLFVIRRYRRLLVSSNGDVTVVETTGDQPSTPNSVGSVAVDLGPSSSAQTSKQSTTNNSIAATKAAAKATKPEQEQNQKIPSIVLSGQRSQTVRETVKSTRQALLHLNIGNQPPNSPTMPQQNHFLLTASTSCPNISDLSCPPPAVVNASSGEHHPELAESGIGSDMDSPRSHPPPLVSPPSSSDGNQVETPADLLLEMRFEPPPGFGDSEDEQKCVVDNPLCFDEKAPSVDNDCPPLPPRHLQSPASPPVSSATSRTHSIDDIVVSFNMALKGTLGCDEEEPKLVCWSPTCNDNGTVMITGDGSNVVTVSLIDDMPPPPPELSETTLESTGFPPSECAPPPPPPYPFPLPAFDDHNIGVSSDSGTDEIITATIPDNIVLSPIPAPVLIAANNLPSDQLRATITRVLLNRTQAADVDAQLSTTMADSSALRFSLSVFGTQDFNYNCNNHELKIEQPNFALLDEISDKLVNSCRAVLTSIGHGGKLSFSNSSSDAVLAFAETASFLLDFHCNNNGATSLQRISHLSSALTHALDAFNCCLQTGLQVVEEQMLTSPETTILNEKLKQLLLNAAWLARSLAVFCSLSIQMKQDAAITAGEVLNNNKPATVEKPENDGKEATSEL